MPDNNQQVDISQSSYDWDIMSNNYDVTAATQESKNALLLVSLSSGMLRKQILRISQLDYI